jgi:hypothetical protein
MAAALVLCMVAGWQTVRLMRQTPPGTPATALVTARELRLPEPGAAYAESTVTLLLETAGGVTPLTLPHPPASRVDLWVGARVPVVVTGVHPLTVVFAPSRLAGLRRAVLIGLGATLALAAALGLAARTLRRPA